MGAQCIAPPLFFGDLKVAHTNKTLFDPYIEFETKTIGWAAESPDLAQNQILGLACKPHFKKYILPYQSAVGTQWITYQR